MSGVDLAHGAADRLPHLGVEVDGAEAPRHVGDVDAPAVEGVRRLQPFPDDRVRAVDEPAPQLLARPVELRQRPGAEPALVLEVLVVEEVVERALRRRRVAPRRAEPLVPVAGVVARQVADHAKPSSVRRLDEPHERLVAAEQRVDDGERRRVVAVVGGAREDGREVEQRHPEVDEVVEVLDDPVEVPAVELLRTPGEGGVDGVVPGCRDRPVRRLPGVGCRGAGEPVGEDLVHHRLGHPRRRGVVGGDEREVIGVERLGAREPCLRQPVHPPVGVLEHEPVAVAGILDDELRLPPGPAVDDAGEHGIRPLRLVVGVGTRADGDEVPVLRHPHPHPHGVAERGGGGGDVEGGSVVMGRGGRVHDYLTAPEVSPLTM